MHFLLFSCTCVHVQSTGAVEPLHRKRCVTSEHGFKSSALQQSAPPPEQRACQAQALPLVPESVSSRFHANMHLKQSSLVHAVAAWKAAPVKRSKPLCCMHSSSFTCTCVHVQSPLILSYGCTNQAGSCTEPLMCVLAAPGCLPLFLDHLQPLQVFPYLLRIRLLFHYLPARCSGTQDNHLNGDCTFVS